MKKKSKASVCKERLASIKCLLLVRHLMELDFGDIDKLDNSTFVLWSDNKGYTHDDPVIGVRYDGKELCLLVDDRDCNSTITLYEGDFAQNEEWLAGIYENMQETLDRNPKLKNRNPIKSKKARNYLRKASHYFEGGGYAESDLLQTVVLAEYELEREANAHIKSLVETVIELRRKVDDGHCPDNPPNRKLCDNCACEECKNLFYKKQENELLKQFNV